MTSREELCWKLHTAVIEAFLEMLREEKPLKASMVACMVQFLKDNGINATNRNLRTTESYLEMLQKESLPFT